MTQGTPTRGGHGNGGPCRPFRPSQSYDLECSERGLARIVWWLLTGLEKCSRLCRLREKLKSVRTGHSVRDTEVKSARNSWKKQFEVGDICAALCVRVEVLDRIVLGVFGSRVFGWNFILRLDFRVRKLVALAAPVAEMVCFIIPSVN